MGQTAGEDAHDHREGRGLGAHRHEGCHWNRRALVHVGRPHMERSSRDLEREADAHKHDAEEEQRIGARGGAQSLRDVRDHRRPRASVDQRHAVQHEGAGEAAHEEVLGRGLLGAEVGAREAAHDVKRDRKELEAEEHGHERRRRGEHHHPDDGGHRQDVELRLQQPAPLQVGVRERDGEDAQACEQDLEEERESVACRELVVRVAARPVQPAVERGSERVGEPDHREHGRDPAAA